MNTCFQELMRSPREAKMCDVQPKSSNRYHRRTRQRAEKGGPPRTEDTSSCVNGQGFIHAEGCIFKVSGELRQDRG